MRLLVLGVSMATLFLCRVERSYGAEFEVVAGLDEPVCQQVVVVLGGIADDKFPVDPSAIAGRREWRNVLIHWPHANEGYDRSDRFTYYDVDNDGEDEVLVSRDWGASGHTREVLVVLEQAEIDFTADPVLAHVEANKAPRISSESVEDQGIYNFFTAPLTFDGQNYVLIMDELFARIGYPTRALVVAKYRGVRLSADSPVDRLQVICRILPRDPFVPYHTTYE